jgi:hypothetical protein
MVSIANRTNYAIDILRQLREPLGMGDTIDVPYLSALTVTASGATGASPQSVTTNIASLAANLEPAIFAAMPQLSMLQIMDGAWADQLASEALSSLKNSIDNALCRDYLAQTLAWTTSTAHTYHDNVEGDELTEDDILNAIAAMTDQDGVQDQNLAFIVGPYGMGAIQSIAGFVPNGAAAEKGVLGIPRVGSVYGVPVFKTSAIKRNLTATATASVTSSGTFTITVPSGHGFVAGMPITTAGGTADVDASTAITSTTSTSITVSYGSSSNSPNGTMTVSSDIGTSGIGTTMNLLVDTSACFVAQQRLPKIRYVDDYDSTDTALQVSAVWGRIGIAGRCRVIHSPGSSVAG